MNIEIFNYFKKKKIRKGRGYSSGYGKTCCKGHKGQKSRSGYNIPILFEGGQTNIFKRKPKIRQKIKKKIINKFSNILYESKKFY